MVPWCKSVRKKIATNNVFCIFLRKKTSRALGVESPRAGAIRLSNLDNRRRAFDRRAPHAISLSGQVDRMVRLIAPRRCKGLIVQ